MASSLSPIRVDDMPAPRRSLRIALVTETWPPEVNGVAQSLHRVFEGLRARHHDIQLVRPCQAGESMSRHAGPFGQDVLVRGFPIPRYAGLKMGAPSRQALAELWGRQRPDLVHVATEGPLGWSALQAAAQLGLPVCSDFRTNFHAYSRHYGIGWLQKPIMGYLRSFHNRTSFTMVPGETLRQELARSGFERLVVVARGVDTALFDPRRRRTCGAPGVPGPTRWSCCPSAGSRARRTWERWARPSSRCDGPGTTRDSSSWATVPQGRRWPSACRMPSLPGHVPAKTWRPTMLQRTPSCFRA